MIVFYLQGECFLLAVRNISTCREKHFYLQSEKLLVAKDREGQAISNRNSDKKTIRSAGRNQKNKEINEKMQMYTLRLTIN